MKKTGITFKWLLFLSLLLLLAGCGKADAADVSGDSVAAVQTETTGQVAEKKEKAAPASTDSLASEFAGKKIGVITGSVFDQIATEHLPESSVEYINSSADIALSLESGRIDAYIADEPTVRMIQKAYDAQYIHAALESISYGFVFPKGREESEQLRSKFDAFISELRDNGTLTELFDLWLGDNESEKTVDFSGMTGENGEITLAISTDVGVPFSYVKYDRYAGYDVDIAVRFCKAYGYSLKISDFSFSGMLAGVAGGKCDFGASSIVMTEERAEKVNFSVPYYEGSIVLAAKKREETDTDMVSDPGEYEKLRGVKIGVLTGSIFDEISQKLIPDCQVELYNTNADLALALESGKIDAYMTDQPIARMLLRQYPEHHVFGVVSKDSYGYLFPKNSQKSDLIRVQMNGFLKKLREEKTLREIDNIWFGDDESKKTVDFSGMNGVNGELTMAVSSSIGPPFCYVKNGQYAGYDIDIAVRFCKEYGYRLKLEDGNFGSIITAVSSGKCDLGASCITITEERKESVNFSDSNYDGGVVIVIRDMLIMKGTSRAKLLNALTGKRIGALTGGSGDVIARESIPECRIEYFNSDTDMAAALDTYKIDAYITDEPVARELIVSYPGQQIYINLRDDPYYENHAVLVARSNEMDSAEKDTTEHPLWQSVKDSFFKTFIRESRWRLFMNGIGVTLIITLISAVCGTVLAFLVFLLYRKNYRLPNILVDILSDIFEKTPVVVVLMILYYLIFVKSSMDGIAVSCIGFSLIFSCSVLGCLKVAVGAVDIGQMEAAEALGYSDTHAFLRVILPQAMRHFLPVYRGEIVTLIKATAIVGYIAVQDLTKVSDIVRSRTYEAFFPLVASAVIYFAIAWLLTLLVKRIQIRTDPKRRKNKPMLKGVKTR